jgi:hypothetical protein
MKSFVSKPLNITGEQYRSTGKTHASTNFFTIAYGTRSLVNLFMTKESFRHFVKRFSMCIDQEQSEARYTPRYFTQFVEARGEPSISIS